MSRHVAQSLYSAAWSPIIIGMYKSRRGFLGAVASAAVSVAAPAQTRSLVIDAHCHAGIGTQMTAPWTTRADLDITLRHMDEAGIDRTIIFPVNNPTYTRANEAIAEMCGRHPTRLIGFAKHDPESESGHVPAMLKREVEKLGLKGLKLHKLPTRDMLDAVAELDIPVLYHPKAVTDFYMIAEEYPQVRFIMAHMGGYGSWLQPMQGIAIAKQYPNVWVDTSQVTVRFIERAVKELGPDKIIFGSDGPEQDSRVELYKIRLLKLPATEEGKILGGNIRRVLPRGTV
jgi:predicted TIM-barrel fold metal-dependent hydrolase